MPQTPQSAADGGADLFEIAGIDPRPKKEAQDQAPPGDVDLFELGGISVDVPKPKPQGIGGYVADAITDVFKRAGGAALSGVAAVPEAAQSGIRATVRSGAGGDPATVMPGGAFIPGIDTDEAINGPMTQQQRDRRELQAERAAVGVRLPGAEALARAGRDAQKAINDTTSQATQDAVANSQITGNLLKGEIDFGKDPSVRGFLMQGADVFGSMFPVVATALATRSPGAAGAVGGAMAAGEGVENAREFIAKQSHEQLLDTSPLYRRMIDAGAAPDEARRIASAKAEDASALLQGAVATFGDRFTGKLVTGGLDPLLARVAGRSVLGKTAAGAGISALEEGTQELTEGVASDLGTKSVAHGKEIGEDSAANFVLGALGGSAPGAARGVVAGVKDRRGAQADAGGRNTVIDVTYKDADGNTVTDVATTADAGQGDGAAAAPAPAPAQTEQQAEQQRVQQPDGTPESMDRTTAATRLAELEVIDSTTGLNPVQQEERAALAQRLEQDAAREAELEALGDEPQAVAAEAAAAEQAPAFDPGAVRSKTWPQFVHERGEKVATLRRGTPIWDQLQHEWAAVKTRRAGTNPEGTGAAGTPAQEIQNRDRSRPASVVQMQGMAQNPDYLRLGVSRSPESGAPMVFAVGDQADAVQALGRADVAVMSDGQRVPFRYGVMEAADVQPSNFADGAVNPLFDAAHPGTVKALNNGRVAGLRAAYERGTADAYRQELAADSAMHGIDPAAIADMQAPVLVRLYSEKDNQVNMGAKSQSQALGLSATEQAATDAALVDGGVLEVFDSGALDSAANRDFARAFIGKLQEQGQDVAGMMDANGALSPTGVTRLQAALVHKAYGDGDLVESLFGSTDNDIRAIGESLKAVAGEWANLRLAAERGAINAEVDVTENLLQAIRLVQKARRERAALHDAVQQVDMLTGDVPDALTVGMLRLLYSGHYLTRPVGRDRLVESLRAYMAAALATSASGDMFGEQVGPAAILAALSGQPVPQRQQTNDTSTDSQQAPAPTPQGSREPTGSDAAGERADAAGPEARRQEPDGAGRATAGDRADRPGQEADADSGAVAPALELSSYTPEEIQAQQAQQQEAEQRRAREDAQVEARARAERERKEVAERQAASAENFQLGQDAQDALSGQKGIFDTPAEAEPAQRHDLEAMFDEVLDEVLGQVDAERQASPRSGDSVPHGKALTQEAAQAAAQDYLRWLGAKAPGDVRPGIHGGYTFEGGPGAVRVKAGHIKVDGQDRLQFPIQRLLKLADPAKSKPRGQAAQKAAAQEAERAAYFTPGNIVRSQDGTHDRVVSYTAPDADGRWSVTVRPVEKEGDAWVDVPGLRERTHGTQPDARALKAGPVAQVQPERGAGEALASAAKNAGAGLAAAIDGLGELFGGAGKLGSGLSFDEQTYAKAKPLFAQAVANLQDAGTDLRDTMRAVVRMVVDKFGPEAAGRMKPYVVRYVEDMRDSQARAPDNTPNEKDIPHVSDTAAHLERHRPEPAPVSADARAVRGDPRDAAGDDRQAPGQAGRGDGPGRSDDSGVQAGDAAVRGKRSDQRVHRGDAPAAAAQQLAGTDNSQGVLGAGSDGVPARPVTAGQLAAITRTARAATRNRSDSSDERSAERAVDPAVAPSAGEAAHLANVRAALPQLLPGQQEDVAKTERAFAAGPGMLLTNGTGTGKTFSGLGAVRRFVDAGKKNVLVVVPDDKIGADWMHSGRALDLNIQQLPDSTVAGRGVTLTTYANLGMNDALAGRAWDLVVADEAHTLMSSQEATPTAALARLRAITMHPDGAHARYQMLHAADLQAAAELRQKADDAREAGKTDQAERLEARARAAFEKLQADLQAVRDDVAAARGDGRRTKLLALSATPFAYELNVDWANGYLFDYDDGRSDESREFRGYNEGGNREQFFMQHFGYRMRYNKLTQPEAGVDRGLMQRQFNTWLKRRGVLSSRLLDVKADYDRRFVLFESAIGNRIDEAFTWLADHRRDSTGHAKLEELVNKQVDYLTRRYLLEAIKATEAVPIVRAHMALGRKVVVFHDYIKGGGVNPFALDLGLVDAGDRAAVAGALAEFQGQFGDLERAQLHKLPSPLQVFRQEFPELLLVNGREKRRDNLAAYEAFNDDERGPSVMLVQSAKDKGWSGHDTTGKHQRVLINLGLPTSPTKSIQQEGRVYRTGQVSNAIMRYLNTGTSWERTAFASTIATRAATAENLALGELARSLQDAYVQAFEEADTYEPGHEGEGTGGKDMDRARNNVISEWDRARSLYFSQQKKTSATKAREGTDYFATPEPLGLKMVEWGDVREGEDTAEPSAGHGAIARWLPTHSRRTMVEPSPVLRSRLALADVRDSDRIVAGSFEDLAAANKYDVIVMNPPFGTAGRTAVDHLAKAYSHLRDGGRVVAIIPTGPAADKKLEAWLYERAEKADKDGELPYTKPDLHRAADVLLPASTFSRAAAGVMTRVVVLDKLAKGEQPARAHRQIDLTDVASVEELFERLEHLDLPARTKPRQEAAAAGPAPAGAQPATAPSTAAPQAQPAPAQLATGEPGSLSGQLQRDGRPLVTHTTKSGKPLQGVVVQGMDRDTAMLYDAYTFKKDGGYFIRAKHLAREGVGFRRGESAVAPAMTADLAQELLRIAGGNVPGAGRGAQQAPMARAQKVVDAVRKAWANAPRINVVFDLQDPRVPQEARDADQLQAAEGAEGVPKGFYFDGEVYLVASQLATPEEAARVLYHEALGHHGLRGAFGEKLDAVLDQIIVARPREVRAKLQEYGELDDLVGRRYAAEEVLAEMAETQPQLGFVRRAVAAIRAWLRTHVPALRDLAMTDAEIIRDFILPARRWVERGALAAASAPAARPAFSLDSGAGRRALQELSELDDLFTFPKSEQTDLAAIAKEHNPEIVVSKPISIAGRQEYTLTMPGGKKAILSVRQPNPYGGEQVYDMLYTAEGMEAVTGRPGVNPEDVPPTPDVWLDVSRLDQGDSGAMAYSIASTFAHNTDSIFIGDPHGLSKTALRRRLEQMISSALKFGTTRHLAPHPDQVRGGHGVPGLRWVYGDDVGNVERMIAASLEGMDNAFPSSNQIAYDAERGTFRLSDSGQQLSRQQLAGLVGQSIERRRRMDASAPGDAEAGWRTVARAAVWRSLLRGESSSGEGNRRGRGAVLGRFAERHAQVLGDPSPKLRVFYSRGPAAGAATPAPSTGLLSRLQGKVADLTGYRSVDDFLYTWQDKFIDLKRIQEHIKALNGTVSETNDAYRGEELYHKRVAKRTANFLRDEVQPLLRRLNATGVAIEELERFLHARHAPEANRVMAERNPGAQQLQVQREAASKTVEDLRRQLQRAQARGMATGPVQKALGQALIDKDRWDGAEAFAGTEEERLSLSGMSDAEAATVMAGYSPEQRQVLDELAARVDRMNEGTLQTLENYGLMDQATLTAWRKTYQHYVPLHRDEAHPESKAHPIGQGFSTKGDAAKKRTGSNERVTNILSHIVMQREAALTRGEKNNVVKRLYLLAAQNPDKDLWSLELPKKKALDPDTGLVRTMVDHAAKLRANVVSVRIGGKDQYIVFNERNEKAVRLAIAMKNMDAMELDRFTRGAAWITRWFASVNTQYNPVFGVMNLARDLQGAMLQLSTTPLAGKQADVFRNIRSNTRAIYKDLRRERREEGAGTSEWAKLWEQLQLDGGTTGYRDLHADPQDRAKKLQKALDQVGEGKVVGSGRALLAWLSDFNETLEATTRLGVYKAALDQGISRQEAASIAKNITVNFNRKGRNMPVAGAHFAFLNAAIQGNKRMLETLAGPAGRRIMMGGVALGMVSAMAGYLMMGGGDGADDDWKKIPDFVKERSIIIPLGRQDYVAIPLPLGFHVFPNIGRTIVEMAVHDDPTKSRMGHVLDMAVVAMDAYNPLGGSSNLKQMLSPTWFDPALALIDNKDWRGREIYREDRSSKDPKPGAARAKDSTAAPFRWVATAANASTGGNEWRPGAFSPTPEAIEYLFGQITGGVGREASKVASMATAAWTGEELAAHQLVLVGRVYGNSRGVNGQSAGYYENVKRINVSMAEAKGRVERGEEADAVLLDVPLAQLDGAAGLVDKHISNLVKARRRIQASDAPNKRELVKEVNAEIEASMHRLNQATAEVLRQVQH